MAAQPETITEQPGLLLFATLAHNGALAGQSPLLADLPSTRLQLLAHLLRKDTTWLGTQK